MIKHSRVDELDGSLPDLPAIARTTRGIEFDPRKDLWAFRDALYNIHIDFSPIRETSCLVDNVKLVLFWYMENASSRTAEGNYYRAKKFFQFISAYHPNRLHEISSEDILNYRDSFEDRSLNDFSSFLSLLKKWNELGISGISEDAAALIKKIRIKARVIGGAVSTMDPYNGPFTDIEFDAIQVKLDSAYEDRVLSLEDYALVLLIKALGQRPIQYAALKVCDFSSSKASDGSVTYSLKIPRAKQQGKLIRDEFKDRLLTSRIGEVMALHCEMVEDYFSDILENPKQAPIFPNKNSKLDEPKGFEYHCTSAQINQHVTDAVRSLNIVSERTGEPLHVFTYRFRRTVGTRAAIEGHGELIIAELLDHSDTQCVGVYVQAVPQIVERIDRAMAMHLAPLAQAFEGVIISDESEASFSGEGKPKRVSDPRFDSSMKPMGNCGKHGFCEALAPIACYTCRNFQPWLDGPHDAVLDYLIEERERHLANNDSRIASINDRTILAVAEVVRRCNKLKDSVGEIRND